jgi:hypothetical protein
VHGVGKSQNNSGRFLNIRRENQNNSYIAVSHKRSAILQREAGVYSKVSRSHNNCSFREKGKNARYVKIGKEL